MFFRKKITKLKKLYFYYSTGNYKNGSISYTVDVPNLKLIYKADSVSEEHAKEYIIDDELISDLEASLTFYRIDKWDRFHKSNRHVKDGNTFSLSIIYKKDKQIYAHGYEKYPRNYKDVRRFLEETLSKYIK